MKIPRYGGALRTLEVNVDGSHAVFDVAMGTGAHVVMASTSDVYGNAVPPFAEEDPIVLGPPTSVRWSYATSKLFDEHLALRLAEERDLQGHDPAPVQRLRAPQPPHLVGRSAVALLRGDARRQDRSSCTATAARCGASPT